MTSASVAARPSRRLLRATAAAGGVAGFMLGIPALLVIAAGWPLPRHLPGVAEIGDALSAGWRPDVEMVVKTFATVAWIIWAQIAASVVVELRASRLGRSAPAVPFSGWCRPLAVRLAATILTLTPLVPRAAGAATLPVPTPVVVTTAVTGPPDSAGPVGTPAEILVSPARPTAAPEPAAVAVVTHTVRAGDTLWDLAAHHLDDPLRWREVFELNRGRPQADGRQLDEPGLLRPGWRIDLPAPPSSPPPTADVNQSAPTPANTDELARNTFSDGPEFEPSVTPAAATVAEPTDQPTDTSAGQDPTLDPGVVPVIPDPPASEAGSDAASDTPDGQAPDPLTFPTGSAEAAQPVSPPREPGPSAVEAEDRGLDGSHVTVGIPALVAGAFLGYLGGLRRDRERWRRRHHRFPQPAPEQAEVERLVRAVPGREAVAWVDLAMRHLAATVADEGAPPPPDILAVRAGALGVEVLVGRPWPVAAGRFVPVDDGRTWRLDPAVDLDELTELAHGVPAYLPALVTLGETDGGGVLVDLDHLGSLAVNGDTERVLDVLESVALELATAPWADAIEVCLIGVAAPLAGLERVRVVDPDSAVTTLRREAGLPMPAGLAAAATSDIPPGPTVAVIGRGALEPDDLAALLDAATPHSGLAVVAADAGTEARWQLALAPSGDALLFPLGLALTVTTQGETTDALQSILRDTATRGTDVPDAPLPADTGNGDEQPAGPDPDARSDDAGSASGIGPLRRLPLVEVRILGPIEITWPAEAPRPQVGELVAYLATHPPAVGAERARLALWPTTMDDDRFGERNPATFHNLTSKVRKALGANEHGDPLLIRDAAANTFRLSDAVGCDWAEFTRLVKEAGREQSGAATLLREALSLVRGRPFQDPPPGYAWVELERLDNEIEAAIADAALDLTDLALAGGDLETAKWAIRQGSLAVPHSEPLLRAAIRVAAAAGDRTGVERAWQDARRLAAQVDPTGEPEPDTVALYRELRSSQRGT